jgi:hypothetical protein
MPNPVQVIVVEGRLEVPATQKLLAALNHPPPIPEPINKVGRGNFWPDMPKYNQAAAWGPVLAVADLETAPCASGLIRQFLPTGCHPNLLLRLSVRMLESWLLAHREAFAGFLKISRQIVPADPDQLEHPKRTLVNLARRSRVRAIREDLVPEEGSPGVVGKGYTSRLTLFIQENWDPLVAQKHSASLRRALVAIQRTLDL